MNKKICRAIGVMLAGISLIFTPLRADAQSGEKVLGLAGGFATYNSSGYTDVFFQYTFAPHVRIAPELGYIFRNEGKSGFEISADMQFPFRIVRGFSVYPLAGLTFNNWNYRGADDSVNRVGLDFGAGFDLRLTSNLKLMLQGKYSVMKDTGGAFFNMGIGYSF